MAATLRYCHVLIAGRVQGVGYRAATQHQAREFGLVGWARNLPDGRVEALLVGEATAVDRMLAWCWEGPPAAAVTSVVVTESLTGFEIRT